MKCRAVKQGSGMPCRATAIEDEPFCEFHAGVSQTQRDKERRDLSAEFDAVLASGDPHAIAAFMRLHRADQPLPLTPLERQSAEARS